MFLSCAAGAIPAGIMEGYALSAFEKEIGAPLCDIFQGAYVSSVGSALVTPTLIKNPDDPQKPLFTAQKAFEVFQQEFPVWTSDNVDARLQLLSSFGVRIPFMKHAFHYNEAKIEDSIDRQIGNSTLSDLMISYFVPVHRLSSATARDTAALYHKIIDADGNDTYNPTGDIKLKNLIRGTTAVPGLFKTVRIQDDYVCDFGHMDDAAHALIRFQKSRPKDADIHFIGIGPPRYHGHYTPSLLDRIGIVRQSLHLARSTSHHSYSSTLGLCEDFLGADNVHDLSPDIDVSRTPHPNASRSILDTTPAHIASLHEMAYANTMTDEFRRVRDLLGENYQAWRAPAPEVPPALANTLSIKNPHSGILAGALAGMRAMIFGKPPEAVFH